MAKGARWLKSVLCALLIGTMLCACGTHSASVSSESSQEEEMFWTTYLEHLSFMESCLSLEDWAYGYAENFFAVQDWESLYEARSACIIAAGEINDLQVPSADFTDEAYMLLVSSGLDMVPMAQEFSDMEEQKDISHRYIRDMLLCGLEMDFYDKDRMQCLSEEMEDLKLCNQLMAQYYMELANYILLCRNGSVSAADIREMESAYPHLTENFTWYQSKSEVWNATEKILDRYEEADYNYSVVVTELEELLYDEKQSIESGNTDDFITVLNIADSPEYLPIPDWYDADNTGYRCFYRDADGNMVYPTSRDDLSGYTDYENYGVYMQTPDVEESQFTEYISYLTECGNTVDDLEENDYIISMDDYSVEMIYEGGTVTVVFLGTDITFVPEYLF